MGVVATPAPCFTSGLVLSALRFQTVMFSPAVHRFFAMGSPISPIPRNAILVSVFVSVFLSVMGIDDKT